jgi:hypothetical protein
VDAPLHLLPEAEASPLPRLEARPEREGSHVMSDDEKVSIIINPGTWPVKDATFEQALANMEQLERDAKLARVSPGLQDDKDDGRFHFIVIDQHGRNRQVDMPGCPLLEVRYMREDGQNIWDFPRLYVDGDSWVWYYAVRRLEAADND